MAGRQEGAVGGGGIGGLAVGGASHPHCSDLKGGGAGKGRDEGGGRVEGWRGRGAVRGDRDACCGKGRRKGEQHRRGFRQRGRLGDAFNGGVVEGQEPRGPQK